jgi:TetR/AcrR family fatty acid metabolism transcriptional regulator
MAKTQKQLQSEGTRQRIIDAAIQLFARKGYHQTSITDLASVASLTKGALYHHFANKDALLYAVLQAAREIWREEVVRDVLKARSALDRLNVLFENHARLIREREMFCLMLSGLVMEMDGVDEGAMVALREIFADLTLFIQRIIEKGQRAGEIRSDLDARLTALNIIGMLEGNNIPWMLNRGQVDYGEMMRSLEQILMSGVRPQQ